METPEAGTTLSKSAAIREAMDAGHDKPADIKVYVREKHQMDLDASLIYTVKQKYMAKRAKTAKGQKRVVTRKAAPVVATKPVKKSEGMEVDHVNKTALIIQAYDAGIKEPKNIIKFLADKHNQTVTYGYCYKVVNNHRKELGIPSRRKAAPVAVAPQRKVRKAPVAADAEFEGGEKVLETMDPLVLSKLSAIVAKVGTDRARSAVEAICTKVENAIRVA